MTVLLLAAGVVSELVGNMALRASDGLRRKRWAPVVVTAYVFALSFLSLALGRGLGVGVAYGIWAASGVALTAVVARLVFGDPLTRRMGVGLALIAVGVLLVEVGVYAAP